MSATVNVSEQAAAADNTTTLETVSFTIAAGSNKRAWVWVGSGAGTPVDPSAVKIGGSGGTSLTQQGATLNIGGNGKLSLWELLSEPSAGSTTVHVTWGSAQDERWIMVVVLNDVDQTAPKGTVATATGTNYTATVNVVSVAGDLVLDGMSLLDLNGQSFAVAAGAGQTELEDLGAGVIGAYESAGCSGESAAGTSTTMSWTIGAGSGSFPATWGTIAFAVNGAAALPPSSQPPRQSPRQRLATLLHY